MRKEEIIRRAKRHAARWNEFRLTIKHDFTRSELLEITKGEQLPYYDRMATYVISKKINVTEVGVAYYYNTIPVMRYRFNNIPIHYSTLVEVIEAATSFRRTPTPTPTPKAATDCIAKPKAATDCIATPQAEDGKLVSFSDAELVAELRKRGFEVIAKKTIEL